MSNMKSIGMVRKIDELGRIVIPVELRRTLDINIKDPVEIFVDEEMIILKKYNPSCIFCNEYGDLITYMGKNVCSACAEEMKKSVGVK